MPATIRLKRVGRKKQSAFRIVVADESASRDAPAVDNLGIYNPRTQPSLVRLDAPRALRWLREGALPSDTVRSIFRKTGLWEKFAAGVTPEELTEAELRLGPAAGQQKTSGRRAASEAAEKAKAEAKPAEPEVAEEAAAEEEVAEEEEAAPEASVSTAVPGEAEQEDAEAEQEEAEADEGAEEEEEEEEEEEVKAAAEADGAAEEAEEEEEEEGEEE